MLLKKIFKRLLPSPVTYQLRTQFFLSSDQKSSFREKVSFYSQFLSKGDLVFDIGANVGNRIDAFLALGARVIAVEPQSSCQETLTAKYGRRIVLIRGALGSEEGIKEMFISKDNVLSSFSPEWIEAVKNSGRFSYTEWNEKVKVEMMTLDQLISTHGKPTFTKIDVEGFEYEVLQGLSIVLPYLSFEFTLPEGENKLLACLDQLQGIHKRSVYNFSIGESMVLALPDWVPREGLLQALGCLPASELHFGDIYCKMDLVDSSQA